MRKRIKQIIKVFLYFIAVLWILHTFSKNFIVDPDFKKFLAEKNVSIKDSIWFIALRTHIILALIALFAGLIGFIERFRQRNLKVHRYTGRIYVLSILLNFIPSIYLACFATGGVASGIGFFALNLIWVSTTYKAYLAARKRQIQNHRRWMIRSFTVTLANLQLYVLKTILSKTLGINFELAYTIAVWSCWIFGLLIAEIIIRKFSKNVSSSMKVLQAN